MALYFVWCELAYNKVKYFKSNCPYYEYASSFSIHEFTVHFPCSSVVLLYGPTMLRFLMYWFCNCREQPSFFGLLHFLAYYYSLKDQGSLICTVSGTKITALHNISVHERKCKHGAQSGTTAQELSMSEQLKWYLTVSRMAAVIQELQVCKRRYAELAVFLLK